MINVYAVEKYNNYIAMRNELDISEQFYVSLRGFIQSKVANPEDTNDILQDSLYRAQKEINSQKQYTKFTSWIYQIVRNSIIDHYRKKRLNVSLDELNLAIEESLNHNNENKDITKCMQSLIKELPDKYKVALQLTEFHNLSQLGLSKKLGLSVSGAKSRIQRARKKLREIILECCDIKSDTYGNILDHKCKNKSNIEC